MKTFQSRAESGLAALALLYAVGCGARSDISRRGPQDAAAPAADEAECQAGDTRPCRSVCGTGTQICELGVWARCDAPAPGPPTLQATLRDFRSDHPDFEGDFPAGVEQGIVQVRLGDDDKPVYAPATTSPSTTGADNFDDWYHTKSGVNLEFGANLELVSIGDGMYAYRQSQFFPLTGLGFGNEGSTRNYHFTLEVATSFQYRGGETFRFRGDDDLWVFINRQLVIDLGGIHASQTQSVELDDVAERVGLEPDGIYPLHLFFAERHTVSSNFNIETTISEFEFCN